MEGEGGVCTENEHAQNAAPKDSFNICDAPTGFASHRLQIRLRETKDEITQVKNRERERAHVKDGLQTRSHASEMAVQRLMQVKESILSIPKKKRRRKCQLALALSVLNYNVHNNVNNADKCQSFKLNLYSAPDESTFLLYLL